MPHDAGDVKSLQAPRLGGQVVLLNSHTRLEGIEVSGGTGHGVQAQDATDVVVQRCILHHNEEGGITFRDVENGIARNNIVWHNGHGIRNGGLKHGLVVNNDVGYSGADGVLVAWKSEDVEVRGNYIHDHLLWDHPDGLQAYRDVTDLRILDNLITSSGQSVMMEEAIGGTMAGNTFVGSAAVMAIFGPRQHPRLEHPQQHLLPLGLQRPEPHRPRLRHPRKHLRHRPAKRRLRGEGRTKIHRRPQPHMERRPVPPGHCGHRQGPGQEHRRRPGGDRPGRRVRERRPPLPQRPRRNRRARQQEDRAAYSRHATYT